MFVSLLSLCVSSHDDGSHLNAPGSMWGLGASAPASPTTATQRPHNGVYPNGDQLSPCALPMYKHGRYVCGDQSVTLEARRKELAYMEPFDEVNGRRLDDTWPATASTPYAETIAWELEGISYRKYQITRPAGERSPIHVHENAQLTCLKKGKVMLFIEGQEDQILTAPDCTLMPPFTKMSSLSLEDKVEEEYFRFPQGGLDWIVLEPKYHSIQGQWTPGQDQNAIVKAEAGVTTANSDPSLGASPETSSDMCPERQCPILIEGEVYCVNENYKVNSQYTFPTANCPGQAQCKMVSPGNMYWICEGSDM